MWGVQGWVELSKTGKYGSSCRCDRPKREHDEAVRRCGVRENVAHRDAPPLKPGL